MWLYSPIGQMTSCIAFPLLSCRALAFSVRGGGSFPLSLNVLFCIRCIQSREARARAWTARWLSSAGTNTGSSRDVTSHRARREGGVVKWSSIFIRHTYPRATPRGGMPYNVVYVFYLTDNGTHWQFVNYIYCGDNAFLWDNEGMVRERKYLVVHIEVSPENDYSTGNYLDSNCYVHLIILLAFYNIVSEGSGAKFFQFACNPQKTWVSVVFSGERNTWARCFLGQNQPRQNSCSRAHVSGTRGWSPSACRSNCDWLQKTASPPITNAYRTELGQLPRPKDSPMLQPRETNSKHKSARCRSPLYSISMRRRGIAQHEPPQSYKYEGGGGHFIAENDVGRTESWRMIIY